MPMTFVLGERRKMSDKDLTGVGIPIILKRRGIVYCEDCKYWTELAFAQHYCGRLIQGDYNNHDFYFKMDADDFCSKGERINGTRKTD